MVVLGNQLVILMGEEAVIREPDSFVLSNTKPCPKFAMLIWLFQTSNSTNNSVVFTTTTLLHLHPKLYLLAAITSTIVIPYSLPF